MCNLEKYVLCGAALLLILGCERDHLSPIEIKIDEDSIPGSGEPTPSAVNVHVVSGNETLYDVANRYNVDPLNLAAINGLEAPYRLRKDQVLRLPDSGGGQVSPMMEEEKTAEHATPEPPNRQNEKLEDEFARIMAVSTASADDGKKVAKSPKTQSASGTNFNEQEEKLSSPPVVKTAVGADLASSEKPIKAAKAGGMIYPVDGDVILQFGDLKDGIQNEGVNIKAPLGAKVKAAADGSVLYVGNKLEEEFGNVVIIQHDNGLITSYAHLKNMSVKKDARVRAGDVVGSVGTTGDVTEPQLHFEVMKDKIPVNPLKYLQK
ncbi:MAG: M23 family metallopeptidase [Holosporaceae bacterium]|jgi:murein DD-endopeptidase MepM/ murein hydrolase activator NlpD|nr:M23 family metallopeptidase [Holosporaceae bacterium]